MKRIYMAIISILCSIGIAIAISHAWFVNGYDVDPLATGSSAEAYYHSGTGTQSDPFIITTPRHLYNLAWLQYMGRYNADVKTGTNFPATYFKLGTSANGSLDMTGWPLPPIGTAKFPFIGNFNGNGWTISNLTTTNNFSEFGNKHPSGINGSNFEQENCGTIGFFGAIGAYNDFVISNTDTTTGCTYDETNNTAYNFYLNNTNVHTSISTTIIGAVAGYVNAVLAQVGVIQPHLNIQTSATSKLSPKTSNLSDFAVVGYAEDEYTTQKTKSSTIIYNPTYDYAHFNFKGMGTQTDWGGSMNMANLYSRIKAKIPAGRNKSTTYVSSELRYENMDKTALTKTSSSSKLVSSSSNGVNGNYAKYNRTDTEDYQYLKSVYKTSIIITKTDNILNGYTITNSSPNPQYLSISSSRNGTDFTFNVSLATSSTSKTWLIDGSNRLYTYNEDDGYKYYLVANSGLSLSVTNDSSSASTWNLETTQDDEGNEIARFKTNINSSDYYLKYFDDVWTLKNTYAISDGNNHYIKYDTTQTNNIGVATSINDATPFMFTNDGSNPYGKIYTSEGAYIRHNNGTLRIDATNSNNTWSNSEGQLYIQYNNNPNYIQYDSGWTLKAPTTYYIEYNGNYLYLNNSGQIQTAGTTNINIATEFTISNALLNGTGTGTISATIGNQTYYLRYDNYNTFDTSTSTGTYTTWSNDGDGFYQTNNNTDYYIQFRNNSWGMSSTIATMTTDYYAIGFNYSNNEYDLYATTNSVSASTSSYSIWYIDSNSYVYTIINGVKYYLYVASSGGYGYNQTYTLSISTSTSETYMITKYNNKLRFAPYSGYNYFYYLRYDGSLSFTDSNTNTDWQWGNSWYDFDNTPIGKTVAKGIAALSISQKSSYNGVSSTTNEYTRQDGVREPSVFNYIPLNATTTSPYTAESNNTGYIMSGDYESSSYNADIRVSQYALSDINSSYASNAWKNNGILTVGANGYGTSNYIGSETYPESNYSKYASSKSQLLQTLQSNSSYVYGLHFMASTININHLVVAPKVLINGQEYTNYQMPEDCIDFQLASKGYINFFAGTYFPGNDSFFSLHQIIRNSNNKITAIKHISKIYEANSTYGPGYKSVDFVYLYDDETYSMDGFTLTSKYSVAFDKTWIENPESLGGADLSDNLGTYLWYFEIPVNKGEFALGSVAGGTGAYLIYLDIGANAAPVDRTIITQKDQTTVESLVYAKGIQILDSSSTYSHDYDSAVAIIPTNMSGDVSITRSDNTITFSASSTLNSTYKNEGITLNGANWSPLNSVTSNTNILRYVDYNRSTEKLYYTTIYNDGTNNTRYDCYRIDNIATGAKTQITDTSVNAEWGILVISNGSGTPTDFEDFDNIKDNSYGTAKILDYYSYIDTSNISSLVETIDMSISEDSSVTPEPDGQYTYEHSYHMSGKTITMTPDDLLVYIGPDLKASATITVPASNIATVTIANSSYTFTFNASAIDNNAKTITIGYVVPE